MGCPNPLQWGNMWKESMVGLDATRTRPDGEIANEVREQIIDADKKLQSMKERGLYVDHCEKWLAPDSTDTKTMAYSNVSETRRLMSELETLPL